MTRSTYTPSMSKKKKISITRLVCRVILGGASLVMIGVFVGNIAPYSKFIVAASNAIATGLDGSIPSSSVPWWGWVLGTSAFVSVQGLEVLPIVIKKTGSVSVKLRLALNQVMFGAFLMDTVACLYFFPPFNSSFQKMSQAFQLSDIAYVNLVMSVLTIGGFTGLISLYFLLLEVENARATSN